MTSKTLHSNPPQRKYVRAHSTKQPHATSKAPTKTEPGLRLGPTTPARLALLLGSAQYLLADDELPWCIRREILTLVGRVQGDIASSKRSTETRSEAPAGNATDQVHHQQLIASTGCLADCLRGHSSRFGAGRGPLSGNFERPIVSSDPAQFVAEVGEAAKDMSSVSNSDQSLRAQLSHLDIEMLVGLVGREAPIGYSGARSTVQDQGSPSKWNVPKFEVVVFALITGICYLESIL